MECSQITLTKHMLLRMQQRQIPPSAVYDVVRNGDVIETREEEGERVHVLLGFPEGRALHVAVIRDPETGICKVKTAYDPDPSEWTANFRRRR